MPPEARGALGEAAGTLPTAQGWKEGVMKRIVGTFMLLASLGGCMQTTQTQSKNPFTAARSPRPKQTSPNQGPYGDPISPAHNPGKSSGLSQVGYTAGNNPKPGSDLIQMGYLGTDEGDCANCAPGTAAGRPVSHPGLHAAHQDQGPPLPFYNKKGGIV